MLDFAAVIFVFLLALASAVPLLASSGADTVEITTSDDVFTLSLKRDGEYTIESDGYTLTLTVKDGSAHVSHYTCPDGLCAAAGEISRVGQCIICLPAGVSIRVVGNHTGEVLDGIAG